MPELQVDLAVANRFISSLSKSLQALCHGCMDFDSGIEIVGYININIDSGSKVDYVLNEKVLKSTTNSMTFVSNSFLAKKDQPKQTRDGACSPVPQPQITPYMPRVPPKFLNSPFQRAGSQSAPHNQSTKGPQKRTRPDDVKLLSNKKHYLQDRTAESLSEGLTSHSHLMPASSYNDSHSQSNSSTSESTLQLQSIKTETLETDDSTADAEQHLSNDQNQDSSLNPTDNVQVKSDPDESHLDSGNIVNSNDGDNAGTDENTDFKGNFLEPSSSSNPAEDSCSQAEVDGHRSLQADSETSRNFALTDETNMPSTSRISFAETDADMSTENEPTSGISVDYDKSVDNGSYYQSGYDDAGEGSSDAGQFEVIEIDDEDEDVQAMFGDQHSAPSSLFPPFASPLSVHNTHHRVVDNATSLGAKHSRSKPEQAYSMLDPTSHTYKCTACGKVYKTSTGARLHFKIKHCGAFDHYCDACGKGFQQKSHLKSHMSLHMQQKDFECNICGSQYAHKTSLTAHQKLAHGV